MFDNPILWLIVGAVVAGAVVLFLIVLYNRLVAARVNKDSAWSQIDVQLQRRHDLIPNLVETVKGYAKHEQETFDKVIQARNHAQTAANIAARADAERQLSTAVHGLIALAEAYPELKASQNFVSLQEELAATETKVAGARHGYNDAVSRYNALLLSFPTNVIAGPTGFQQAEFFELDPAEEAAVRQVPKIKF